MPRNICICAAVAVLAMTAYPPPTACAGDPLPQVQLNADSIAPRPIEELTGKNITRDYAYAWQTLAQAMAQNQSKLLDGYFTGFAKNSFAQAIASQKNAGLHTRYIDRGHKVDAFFYSPNGDAIELRDNAQLEIQLFDGSKMIHQEQIALHYLVIMTPAADRWVVRLLEAVPNF